jgi:hypothetical protein
MLNGFLTRTLLGILFIMSANSFASAAEDFVLTIGQDKTFKEFNYHEFSFNWRLVCANPVASIEAESEGNSTLTTVSAQPGTCGQAFAFIGLNLTYNYDGYTWERIKNWPVKITFRISYTIKAEYSSGSGAANSVVCDTIAGCCEDPADECIRGQDAIDIIGYDMGGAGTRSRTLTRTYTQFKDGQELTLERLQGDFAFVIHSQARTDEEATGLNTSSAVLEIHYIKVEFVQPTTILLHGIWDNGYTCWTNSNVKTLLERNGFPVDAITFCPNNDSIKVNASVLAQKIASLHASSKPWVNIVAHSMGGLAARYYLAHSELWPADENGNPEHYVGKLITLGTPHLGTDIHLLHPIASNKVEYDNWNKNNCSNYYEDDNPYNYRVWSPGLREMTARWKGPNLWFNSKGELAEPMKNFERNVPFMMETMDQTPYEWWELNDLFPPVPKTQKCLKNHAAYYNEMISELTGGNVFSPFLEDLNARSIPSDISYYLIYGENVKTPYKQWGIFHATLIGEYGDGVVPKESASGQGLPFQKILRKSIPTACHSELPAKGKYLILNYLRGKLSQ